MKFDFLEVLSLREKLLMVLKPLAYGKAGDIFKEKWWCQWQNVLLNFMISYLCLFNSCIRIIENGKYLSHSNI